VITRRSLSFDHPLLRQLEHPCFEARGASDGPRLALIAGVHGCEYSSIAAATRFMRSLDTGALSGSIVCVPIVSLESFRRRSPFVVPVDGKNLNRSFPGDPSGSYTDALAWAIRTELLEPADAASTSTAATWSRRWSRSRSWRATSRRPWHWSSDCRT
jgi:uncharacterized protein